MNEIYSFRNRVDRFMKSSLAILHGRIGLMERAEHYADQVVEYTKVLGVPYYDTHSISGTTVAFFS